MCQRDRARSLVKLTSQTAGFLAPHFVNIKEFMPQYLQNVFSCPQIGEKGALDIYLAYTKYLMIL